MDELDSLHDIANNIMGNTICAFGEGTAMPALGVPEEVPEGVRGIRAGRAEARPTHELVVR